MNIYTITTPINTMSSSQVVFPQTNVAQKIIRPRLPNKGIIYQLKKNGFKIRVRHYRWAKDLRGSFGLYLITRQNRAAYTEIQSSGGRTEVDVTFSDHRTLTGTSICSVQDSYCRRLGAYLAFKRAVELHRKPITRK